MSEKFTPTAEQADPANEAARNEAWGIDEKEFATGSEYVNNRPDTDVSASVDDVIFESNQEDGDIYGGSSLQEIATIARDAEIAGDKSTSMEAQTAIQNRLEKLVESGQITEDGALNRIEQLNQIISPEVAVADDEVLVISTPAETPAPTSETAAATPETAPTDNKEVKTDRYAGKSPMDLMEDAQKAAKIGNKPEVYRIFEDFQRRLEEEVVAGTMTEDEAEDKFTAFRKISDGPSPEAPRQYEAPSPADINPTEPVAYSETQNPPAAQPENEEEKARKKQEEENAKIRARVQSAYNNRPTDEEMAAHDNTQDQLTGSESSEEKAPRKTSRMRKYGRFFIDRAKGMRATWKSRGVEQRRLDEEMRKQLDEKREAERKANA